MENDDWVTGNIKLSLNGEPVEMQMTVPANPVKPQRMLPIFQQMAGSFVQIGINAVESAGEKVSCQDGCCACCYQAIPLAEIEAHQIVELIENLPEPRQSEIKKRFAEACQHFYEIGWFERLSDCVNLSPKEREEVILEYFYEKIPCPFLENKSCSIYDQRPVSCREYLVTSPAENCSNPSGQTVRLIEPPIKISEPLRQVGQTKQLHTINFVPLILALEWVIKTPDQFPEKTGEEWMADFFRNLTKSEIPRESDGKS